MDLYILLKDGHRYNFNKIREVRTEYGPKEVEVFVISGQFLPRQRFKSVRILPNTIKETDIKDLKDRLMMWLS